MLKKIIFSLAFILTACHPIVIKPASVAHSTPVVVDTDLCGAAQANLQKLGCISTTDPYTTKGKSFEEFCRETQNNQIFINPRCLSSVQSCQEMNGCTN
jgi:hypothetical protein